MRRAIGRAWTASGARMSAGGGALVVEERIFVMHDGSTPSTLDDPASKRERIYVNGPVVDEVLYSAVDYDTDGVLELVNLNDSFAYNGGVNADLADHAYFFINNRMGSVMALLQPNLDTGHTIIAFESPMPIESSPCGCKLLEYVTYSVYGEAMFLRIVDDGAAAGTTANDGSEDTPNTLNLAPTPPATNADNVAAMSALRGGLYGASYGRTSSFSNTLTFQGRRWDAVTGKMYFRHRTYDGVGGRFGERDPIATPRTNLLVALLNVPVRATDPDGLAARGVPGVEGKCFCEWDREDLRFVGQGRVGGIDVGDVGLNANDFYGGISVGSLADIAKKVEAEIDECECIDSLEIYAHGHSGKISLSKDGTSDLDGDSAAAGAGEFAKIRDRLCPGAVVYLKVCLVSSIDTKLAQAISNALGATVMSHSGIFDVTGVLGDSKADVKTTPDNGAVIGANACAPRQCCPAKCLAADVEDAISRAGEAARRIVFG